MYCQRCGSLNDDDAVFCASCGAPCDGAAPLNPYAAPAESSMQDVVHDYLVPNILATILCVCFVGFFWATVGFVGICFSSFAHEYKRRGYWEDARAKAKVAKVLFFASLGMGLTFMTIALVLRAVLFFHST